MGCSELRRRTIRHSDTCLERNRTLADTTAANTLGYKEPEYQCPSLVRKREGFSLDRTNDVCFGANAHEQPANAAQPNSSFARIKVDRGSILIRRVLPLK